MTEMPDSYFEAAIQNAIDVIDKCEHVFMGVWPRTGAPRMSCTKCFFTRAMTAEEIAERLADKFRGRE